MKNRFRLFTCLGVLCMLLTGCNNGGGNVEPPVHEHTWGDPTYAWSIDYSSCTAERVCLEDESHKESESVSSTYSVITPAGCDTDGLGRYTVTFTNTAFTTQTYDITIEASGHDWGSPTYVWSSDYSQCTATRVCQNDSSHVESETVNSTYAVITTATEEEEGLGRYTATFTNSAFVTQTVDIVLDKLEPSIYYGQTPILSDDEKTITYGLYPQTNVNDETLVAALNELTTPESNGWYLYEGEYYAKLSASPHASSYKFDNGVTIVSGITYWFKCEPITWNVLNNNNGEYYIVSSLLLDAHCYYNSKSSRTIDGQTVYANNYKYSDIRTWLNNDFYNSAFALGNSHIQTATVDNSASTTDSSSNRYACANTEDKVFLPSYKDYINSSYGFSTSTGLTDTRYCKTTDWARARGAYYSINASYLYNGYYWTRSPRGDYNDVALLVNYDGGLNSYYVSNADKSVRPALTIKIPSYYYGETPILSEDGKTITYGLYPQTNVNNETLVATLNELTTPESNGYYFYENAYYTKVSAKPYFSDCKFDNDTTIVSEATYWFKCEPIIWNVLSNNSGEYYILSSVLLDAHCYYNSTSDRTIDDQTVYPNNYKYSDIRTWLNNDFYNSAFALGNIHIQTTTVDNSAATTDISNNSYACANTEDKVFLPSYQDYINSSYGFSTSTSSTNTRYCRTTDWARARGAIYSTDSSYLYNGHYCTRSPRSDWTNGVSTWHVDRDGHLGWGFPNYMGRSVRPSLSIKIAQFMKQ